MAAETMMVAGGLRVGTNSKLARGRNGMIAGVSGDSAVCDRFLKAIREADGVGFTFEAPKDELCAIVVDTDGTIYEVTDYGWARINAEFLATGAPYQFLTGAMAAGASAEEAVRLAMQYYTHCGGELQTLRLHE